MYADDQHDSFCTKLQRLIPEDALSKVMQPSMQIRQILLISPCKSYNYVKFRVPIFYHGFLISNVIELTKHVLSVWVEYIWLKGARSSYFRQFGHPMAKSYLRNAELHNIRFELRNKFMIFTFRTCIWYSSLIQKLHPFCMKNNKRRVGFAIFLGFKLNCS